MKLVLLLLFEINIMPPSLSISIMPLKCPSSMSFFKDMDDEVQVSESYDSNSVFYLEEKERK